MTGLKLSSASGFAGTISGLALCALAFILLSVTPTVPFALVGGVVLIVAVLVFYILATIQVKKDSGTESAATSVYRGLLVGINSTLNFGLVFLLLYAPLGNPALVIAAVIALINLLACIGPVSQSAFYQGVLGWANWLMPMSWLIVGLGLAFTLFSLLLHLVLTLPFGVEFTRVGIKSGALKGKAFSVDWPTGTFFQYGGLVANLNHLQTAFNMGNFAFVHYKSSASHSQHEAGHTLNLAAFGSLFHLIGAVDEVFAKHRAFAEFLADSNDPTGSTQLKMWS
ncbi:hypothetical protein DES49_1862 [Halospina denitrificans]|uniref:Uncharacterized protein n=1 Tax=Halospina denitrificans TaxID=332522 RepID=A0A4R7JTX9_9GAMM|nr:hypothetical protein [Halospina denitrificans]TDT41760.1 hypothetical protein DES49_1862 [Halospina denitrificans]